MARPRRNLDELPWRARQALTRLQVANVTQLEAWIKARGGRGLARLALEKLDGIGRKTIDEILDAAKKPYRHRRKHAEDRSDG